MPNEGLEFFIFSPQPFRGWGYRRASPHLVYQFKFFSFVVVKKYASSLFARTVCISSGGCFILLPSPVAVTKYLIKGNLSKKGLVLVYICLGEGTWLHLMAGKPGQTNQEASWSHCIHSQNGVIVKRDQAMRPQNLLPATSSGIHKLPKPGFSKFQSAVVCFTLFTL